MRFHDEGSILFHFQVPAAAPSPARPGSPPRGLKNILDSAALTDEYKGFLAGLDSELETNTREEDNNRSTVVYKLNQSSKFERKLKKILNLNFIFLAWSENLI